MKKFVFIGVSVLGLSGAAFLAGLVKAITGSEFAALVSSFIFGVPLGMYWTSKPWK